MNILQRPKCFASRFSQSIKHLSTIRRTPHNPHKKSHLFIKPQRPNYEFSVISSLRNCASILDILGGQQHHCLILKSGLDSNIFIQNSLINFYSKCGLIANAKMIFDDCPRLDSVSCNIMLCGYAKFGHLNEARELFDKMPEKSCVSYTSMIMGLTRDKFWGEVIAVFGAMRVAGVAPNEVTFASVIPAYTHFNDGEVVGESGRMLHGLVVKLGLDVFVLVSTNLLHMYCLGARLDEAMRLFNEMPGRNVVTWNVMLNGYAKAREVDLARELFERIVDKDVVSWGTIIDCYVQVGRLNEALMIYCEMVGSGLGPNDVMIVDIISACGQAMAYIEGLQFHGVALKRGFDCYNFVQATIIHFYAACRVIGHACLQFEFGSKDHIPSWNALLAGLVRNGTIDEARCLFDQMPERDVFSWSTMISGYSQHEQPGSALELFHEMVANGLIPNEVTMVSVLSAIATLGTLKEARWANEYILVNSIPLNDNLNAAIIDMYAKCGSINTALDVFHQIREKARDVSPWNAIICGLAMHGHAEMSLGIFSDLQRRKIKPNSITFVGVLSACCHAGLVEVGEEHFKDMKSLYNIEPNIKHYGCMVDLLGRTGRLEEAEELIRSMPMNADVIIWGTLLAACRTHSNSEMAERIAENLARVEPSHGPSRVLLSNIYAEAGRWDDAFLVRRAMQSQHLTRSPAYSGVA